MKKNLFLISFLVSFIFTGCYSVFSGGASGRVVDAESTSSPKAGISDVEVYAYVDSGERDSDFKKWDGVSRFTPNAQYFVHTTTGQNGDFTISKVIWKSSNSKFGKDADYSKVFLLFYHENFGLVKGSTLIVSDSTSDTVYQEMTRIRKTTVLNLNINDVSTNSAYSGPVLVTVSVPQVSEKTPDAVPLVYKTTVNGNGSLSVSYPRWKNDSDKTSGKETEPEILISYNQSSDQITWKACYNGDSPASDFSFMTKPELKKNISGDFFAITLYGKRTRFSVPVINGKCGDENGVQVSMTATPEDGTEFDCGKVSTEPVTYGNNTVINGHFSNLGRGYYWDNNSYTSKNLSVTLKLSEVSGTKTATKILSTDVFEDYIELK